MPEIWDSLEYISNILDIANTRKKIIPDDCQKPIDRLKHSLQHLTPKYINYFLISVHYNCLCYSNLETICIIFAHQN